MHDYKGIVASIQKANFVYIIGNGGSAATANHFANDLVKMCGIKAISLCSNDAVITAFSNDNGYKNVYIDQLKVFLQPHDLLITISGSGKSENILKSIKFAKKIGANVYSFPTMKEYNCNMQEIEDIHLQHVHKIAITLNKK